MTAKISHSFYSVFDIAVVTFYRIVVVFQSVFPTCNRNTEYEFACSVEKFVECVPVVLEAIGHERDEFAFLHRFVSFFVVDGEYLLIACRLYLPQEIHARRNTAFCAV